MDDIYTQGGYSNFSFPRADALGDQQNGPTWLQNAEGPQNFQLASSQADPLSGITDSYRSIPISEGGALSGIDSQHFPLDDNHPWSDNGSDAMSLERWISQNSVVKLGSPSMSDRTVISEHPDMPQSVELRSTLSKRSFPSSSGGSDVTDSSFSPPEDNLFPRSPYMDNQLYCESPYPEAVDSIVGRSFRNGRAEVPFTQPGSLITISTGSSYAALTAISEDALFTSPSNLMQQSLFESSMIQDGLPTAMDTLSANDTIWPWENTVDSESGVSSPFSPEAPWQTASASKPATEFSSNAASRPPRANRKSSIQQNDRMTGDPSNIYSFDGLPSIDRNHSYDNYDAESNPRNHPLYQNATTSPDGLYHCPWEGQDPSCQHKPEKLKCNYDKFVDSHLKPYRCRIDACENARFSSTACLLRHEREAHAMHGHGEKPFLCSFEGCERGVHGNGFPRHWNLCDHMKRVHNRSPSPSAGTTKASRSSKKRKNQASKTGPSKKSPPNATEKLQTRNRALSLKEEYHEELQQVLSSLQDMPDPFDVTTMQALDSVRARLVRLKNTAQQVQQVHSLPTREYTISQQSG